jgi:hypothetical protein
MLRLTLAFILSPFVGLVFAMLLALWRSGNPFVHYIFELELLAAAAFTYIAVAIFGIPMLLLMLRRRWFSLSACVAASLASALVAWMAALWPFDLGTLAQHGFNFAILGITAAIISAIVFWILGVANNKALEHGLPHR